MAGKKSGKDSQKNLQKIIPINLHTPLIMKTPSSFQFKYEILVVKANDWIQNHNTKVESHEKSQRINSSTRFTALVLLDEFRKALKRKRTMDEGYFETSYSKVTKRCPIDESSVKRHLNKLKKHGFIVELDTSSRINNRKKIRIKLADWIIDEMKDYIPNLSPKSI